MSAGLKTLGRSRVCVQPVFVATAALVSALTPVLCLSECVEESFDKTYTCEIQVSLGTKPFVPGPEGKGGGDRSLRGWWGRV